MPGAATSKLLCKRDRVFRPVTPDACIAANLYGKDEDNSFGFVR
jgi:hypothetical protein